METLTLRGPRVMHQMPTGTQQQTMVSHGLSSPGARCPSLPTARLCWWEGRGEAQLPAAGLGEEEPLAG